MWICCNRSLNHKVPQLHERYCDKKSSFDRLVFLNNTASVPHQSIKRLRIEIFKTIQGQILKKVKETFHGKD